MNRLIRKIPYLVYMLAMGVFCISLIAIPYMAMEEFVFVPAVYDAYHLLCHQIDQRSLCWFGGMEIADCTDQLGKRQGFTKSIAVESERGTGYKIPVCSRDIGIYVAMLAGGAAFLIYGRMDSLKWPDRKILFLAALPIAIDGTGQFIGLWESTNSIRLLTGGIIGFVLPFYLIPMLNQLWQEAVLGELKKRKKKK